MTVHRAVLCASAIFGILFLFFGGRALLLHVLVSGTTENLAVLFGAQPTLLEPPSLTISPLGLRFGTCRFDIAANRTLTIKGGSLEVDSSALLKGKISPRILTLDSPVFQNSTAPRSASIPTLPGANKTDSDVPDMLSMTAIPFQLDQLIISSGKIRLTTEEGDIWTLKDISLTSLRKEDGQIESQCAFSAELRLASGGLYRSNLAAQASITQPANIISLSRARITVTPLEGFPNFVPFSVSLAGGLNIKSNAFTVEKADITIPRGHITLKGGGTLFPPAFAGSIAVKAQPSSMPFLPPILKELESVDLSGRILTTKQTCSLSELTCVTDDVHGAGYAAVDFSPLRFTASLRWDRLNLNPIFEILPVLFTSAPNETDKTTSTSYSARPEQPGQRLPESPNPEISLDLRATEMQLHNQHFSNGVFRMRTDKQNVDIPRLSFQSGSGSFHASGEAELSTGLCTLQIRARSIDAGSILSVFHLFPGVSGSADIDCSASAFLYKNIANIKSEGHIFLSDTRIPGLIRRVPHMTQSSHVTVDIPFSLKDSSCSFKMSINGQNVSGNAEGMVNIQTKKLSSTFKYTEKETDKQRILMLSGKIDDIDVDIVPLVP